MPTVVIALGGALGALARYGLDQAWPPSRTGFPWTTFGINVTGCLLIGVLMVWVVDAGAPHRLWRPFLGVGVLGGYTTFSTYAVEARGLMANGHPALAVGYVLATVLAALAAVWLGVLVARTVVRLGRSSG